MSVYRADGASGRGFPALRLLPGRLRRPIRIPAEPPLGRIGDLEVRVAASRLEVRAAQALRYQVFYSQGGAKPSALQRVTRLDKDAFDRVCDHLIVLDKSLPGSTAQQIVGTYRLLRQERLPVGGRFYTEQEFEIGSLVRRHPHKRFLELGRSCVLKNYRGKRTVELLWQGIWAYVLRHRIDVLFGCASLAGTDLATLETSLSFLRENASAPEEWQVSALPHRHVAMGAGRCADPRRALGGLPPLLKGYLRLGGYIGDGAVVDRQFGTTDVLVVLPVTPRNRMLTHVAFAMIFGGAVGNLIDRVTLGYVTDYLYFHTPVWSFAVFNLADTFITVGAALIILDEFVLQPRNARRKRAIAGDGEQE